MFTFEQFKTLKLLPLPKKSKERISDEEYEKLLNKIKFKENDSKFFNFQNYTFR